MIFYFRYEKARVERQRIADQSKGVGRPKVGGKFELQSHEGEIYTDKELKGGFSLVRVTSCQGRADNIVQFNLRCKLD